MKKQRSFHLLKKAICLLLALSLSLMPLTACAGDPGTAQPAVNPAAGEADSGTTETDPAAAAADSGAAETDSVTTETSSAAEAAATDSGAAETDSATAATGSAATETDSATAATGSAATETDSAAADLDALQKEAEEQLEKELGAFDITAQHRELAKNNEAGYPALDAGRGNPNWINTQARYAFARFMEYAIGECEETFLEENMAGAAKKEGISARFDAAMDPAYPEDAFLIEAVEYCVEELGMDKDDLLKEFVDAIIGDYYPSPSRCLTNTETILNTYLQSVLYGDADLARATKVFPTEGGSAAIAYIFDTLGHNRLLNPGDRIAIATPIFTPYLQIPYVKNYGLVPVNVSSAEEDNWDIAESELKKLEDPSVKAFFLVNPSNPASHALSEETLEKLKAVIEKNPDLIILTDDVYGTFVDNFRSVYSILPHNTILVYSFSKLYGVTGWRIGLIAVNEDNVMDDLLERLSQEDKEYLRDEYAIISEDPDHLPFIDRVTADSRAIGLYHTSGLSTPSQVFMDFLALTHLIYGSEDPYIKLANEIVRERYDALMEGLGLPGDDSAENSRYYTVVDLNALVLEKYGQEFTDWLKENKTELAFLNDLAAKEGVVFMYGPGFEAPEGTVRISLANLNTEDYTEIARRLYELLDQYYEKFEQETGAALPDAA